MNHHVNTITKTKRDSEIQSIIGRRLGGARWGDWHCKFDYVVGGVFWEHEALPGLVVYATANWERCGSGPIQDQDLSSHQSSEERDFIVISVETSSGGHHGHSIVDVGRFPDNEEGLVNAYLQSVWPALMETLGRWYVVYVTEDGRRLKYLPPHKLGQGAQRGVWFDGDIDPHYVAGKYGPLETGRRLLAGETEHHCSPTPHAVVPGPQLQVPSVVSQDSRDAGSWVAFYVDELCGTVGMAESWWLSPYEDGDYEQAPQEEVLSTADYIISPGSMVFDGLGSAHAAINVVYTLFDAGHITKDSALQCLDMRLGNGREWGGRNV